MDKDTFLSKIAEIGTISDEVERRKLLTEVSDEVSKVYDNVSNVQINIEKEHIWITLYWMQILCSQLLM